MARQTVSEEEILLRKRARRRLVGAIALVIVSAIVLPMVFDDRTPPVGNVEIRIQDEKAAPPFVAAVPPVAVSMPSPAPTVVSPVAVSQSSPAAIPHGYYLKVGVFSNEANAKDLRAKLSSEDFKTLVEPMKSEKGLQTKVMVGPFASRDEADKALRKIGRMGILGIVESR
ncbi:MAG: SPOR domain-containing protein [Burkholderiales bacterium]|nr:SPOR domain-containing protein [Burkholderiales bacterium]